MIGMRCLLLFIVWAQALMCYGQTGQYLASEFYSNYLPKNPSSSSLGQFGNIPINYYAGLPEISFELLRLKGREIEVPVSLNYDASGVRTDEFSGEVGLKWNLSAGGYVVRDVKSLPDEHTVEGYWKYSKSTNYFTNLDYPVWVNWIEKNERDAAPDEFTIVIPGRSIRFVFNKDKGIVVIPRQNVRVTYTMSNNKIYGFELITEDGTRYVFGGTAETVATRKMETLNIRFKYDYKYARVLEEASSSDVYQLYTESISKYVDYEEKSVDTFTSRWYLRSIISPVGETTRFIYQNTGTIAYTTRPTVLQIMPSLTKLNGFTYTIRDCTNKGVFKCDEWRDLTFGPYNNVAAVIKYKKTNPGELCADPADCENGYFYPREYRASPGHMNNYFTLITESNIQLIRIESATGNKVVFTRSSRVDLPGTTKVDKITLLDMNGTTVTSYKLNFKEVAADESKDFMWPGEGLIMFHVGTVTQPGPNFTAHHIRKFFDGRISDGRLVKYVYEGLKEYNYRRLFLESVEQLSSKSNESIPVYRFDYKDAGLLKRRTTTLHDSYGYQRTGVDFYGTEWQFQSGKKAVIVNDRGIIFETNPIRGAGILQGITYPSGGYTTFTYNLASLSPRVLKAQDFDMDGTIVSQKEIEYVQSAISIRPLNACIHDFNIWGTPDWMKYFVFSTSALNEYTLTHNSAQGNKTVRVYYGTKTNNTGYEEFTFTSPVDPAYRDVHAEIYSHPVEQDAAGKDLPYVKDIYPFPKSRDRDFIRGMPLSHKVFAAGKTNPIKTTTYSYEVNPYGYVPETVYGLKGGSFNYASHTTFTAWFGLELEIEKRSRYSRYQYQSEWVVLKKMRTITYDPTVADTTKNFDVCTEYEYDPVHLQQIEATTYHRDDPNEKKISRTRYVTHADYNSSVPDIDCQQQLEHCLASCEGITDPAQRNICNENCYNYYFSSCLPNVKPEAEAIQHLRQTRQVNTPIEVQSLVTSKGVTRIVKAVVYKYQQHGNGFSKPAEIYDLNQPVDVGTYTPSKLLSDGTFLIDSRLRLAHTIDSYDAVTAQVQQQTSRDGTVSAYQWGLNKSVVTGYTVNAGTSQQQYLYDYTPLVGLKTTTDPNGRKNRFEYDGFNRLRLTRDHDNNILSRYRYHYAGEGESLQNDVISASCALINVPVSLSSSETVPLGVTSYQWDFGDGTPVVTTTNTQVKHTWKEAGTYAVKVRKENPEYLSKEAAMFVTVMNPITGVELSTTGPAIYDICSETPPLHQTKIVGVVQGDAAEYYWEYQINNGPWIALESGAGPAEIISINAPPEFGTSAFEGVMRIRMRVYDACSNVTSNETTLRHYASSSYCRPR